MGTLLTATAVVSILNTAQRYATIMGLSQVDEADLEIVRNFTSKLGSEFKAIFDALWTHGDESRIEIIAESNIKNTETKILNLR